MTVISGIQLWSRMVENTAAPLDAKTQLTTTDRLALTKTQRWLGMITYDTTLATWKELTTDPSWATTTEANRGDFGWGGGGWMSWAWSPVWVVTPTSIAIIYLDTSSVPKDVYLSTWLTNSDRILIS